MHQEILSIDLSDDLSVKPLSPPLLEVSIQTSTQVLLSSEELKFWNFKHFLRLSWQRGFIQEMKIKHWVREEAPLLFSWDLMENWNRFVLFLSFSLKPLQSLFGPSFFRVSVFQSKIGLRWVRFFFHEKEELFQSVNCLIKGFFTEILCFSFEQMTFKHLKNNDVVSTFQILHLNLLSWCCSDLFLGEKLHRM